MAFSSAASGLATPTLKSGMHGEQLLAWRRSLLAEGGQACDLDWLLDLAGGLSWSALQQIRIHPTRPVDLCRSRSELEAIWREHLREATPLQYLIGVCPWRDLELRVGPGVLIPRQDTESLVDVALSRHVPAPPGKGLLWADLGTGSGCLAIALARALPSAAGLAVDCSSRALSLARSNLEASGTQCRVTLLQGHWWDPLRPWWGRLDVVVANPPYIPTHVWRELDPVVRDHEPRLALDGGADGLDSLRTVVEGAIRGLAPGGTLIVEHHHDQSAVVAQLFAQSGLGDPRAHGDLQGVARFASACRPPLFESSRG